LIVRAGFVRTAFELGCSLLLVACSGAPDIVAAEPGVLELSGDLEAHDPSVIESSGAFYLFSTGTGIATKTSPDLKSWRDGPSVFEANPSWIAGMIPGVGELWSPTVRFFGGVYHLYYAASVFASERSCIGHATRAALGGSEAWSDQGPVVCSDTTTDDNFNAIDPELLVTPGQPTWLVFGSFDTGIKLAQLTDAGTLATGELIDLAARPSDGGALQASALIQHGSYNYLFTSFDLDSSHRTMVGRAAAVQGPYLDRAGTPLLDGGGSLVLAGDARFRGPGSNAILSLGDRDFNVYHAYDAQNADLATLRIAELVWDDQGWPISGGP
jgi:arabinan endo-1,5-alpha-L-arabinosidase